MSQKWEKKKSKVCFVESSFGQKVWSTFPIAQSRIASPFQWHHCCLLLTEIKVWINFQEKLLSKYLTDTIDFNKHDIDIFINDMWRKY